MDTPKREVSWLESFPPDIWAYFVCYLTGEQVGLLIMTGATLLNRRLKAPKVVRSIKLGKDLVIFKSLPRFLNEMPSLEKLSIHRSKVDLSPGAGFMLCPIPSGVRKLVLSGHWNKVKMFSEPSTTLDLSKHLPHLEILYLRYLEFGD